MARAPRKTATLTSSDNPQLERQARRISRQQKQLEKTLISEMTSKVPVNASRMVRYSDIIRVNPLTDTQRNVFQSVENNDADAYLLYGSAGTGKSWLAMYFALKMILKNESEFKKIIIVRSTSQVRSMGYLKGEIEAKTEPFELPYHDICFELTGMKDAYQKLKDTGKIVFLSTAFLRGTSFNDSAIIFDEAQNTTFSEFSTVITRVGKNSVLFVLGDTKQDDLVINKNEVSGFRSAIQVMNAMSDFRSFRFTPDDIVRSNFVKQFIIQCEKLGL